MWFSETWPGIPFYQISHVSFSNNFKLTRHSFLRDVYPTKTVTDLSFYKNVNIQGSSVNCRFSSYLKNDWSSWAETLTQHYPWSKVSQPQNARHLVPKIFSLKFELLCNFLKLDQAYIFTKLAMISFSNDFK